MPSSTWSGHLTFGLISMPVRLFSGARPNHVSFHMLHRDDHVRVLADKAEITSSRLFSGVEKKAQELAKKSP